MNQSLEESTPSPAEPPKATAPVGAKPSGTWMPDLGSDIGSKRWFLSLFVLVGLIGAAGTLGWYALQGPDTGDLFQTAEVNHQTDTAPAADTPDQAAAESADQQEAAATQDPPAPVEPPLKTVDVKLKRNSTLIEALLKAGVNERDAHNAIVALRKVDNLRKMQSGQMISVGLSEEDQPTLQKISYKPNVEKEIFAERADDGQYKSWASEIPLTKFSTAAMGTIDDSLFLSAQRSGVPTAIIVEMIRVFSWDVDFQREIRKGDQYEIFYERYRDDDGNVVKNGDVLYGSLTLRGTKIPLYRYLPQGEKFAEYFKPDGRSAKKMLMRTPVDGARLTSTFGMRHHPILGYTRMHKGIDFGAARGTPIMAAGDGVIERASRYGGYGNYVRIRHNSTYSTGYAHLTSYGKGIRSGVRVHQGQIIGYVGSTGNATGPHLHYEVMMNNKQVNPLSLKLPTGYSLEGDRLASFKSMVRDMNVRIADAENIKVTERAPQGLGIVSSAAAKSAAQ